MSKFELYVHIPFCAKKCEYCDFCSDVYDVDIRKRYIEALCNEIRETGGLYKGSLSSVYIGGGTPSILPTPFLEEIISTISDSYKLDKDAEISMEANPGTVTAPKARSYFDLGINRISMGLQSANDRELATLGRIHTYREFLESFDSLRRAGFKNINVDVMAALPGQTYGLLRNTLREVTMLRPEHISVYSLIIEEGTPFYEKYFDDVRRQSRGEPTQYLPDEDKVVSMMRLTDEMLETAGYNKYEVSNYAKSGFECRHNIGYWKRTPYVGVGLGAASFITKDIRESLDSSWEMRLRNTTSIEDYCLGRYTSESEEITKKDAMSEFMFLGLRMTEGILKSDFYNLFGIPIDTVFGSVIEKYKNKDLLLEEEGRLRFSEYGMDVSNIVLADYM